MKFAVACDECAVLMQIAAALGDGSVEIVERSEVFVGERLVDERPQVLGGLQFGRAGGLIEEADAVWNGQVLWPMPSGLDELQNDDAIAAGAGLARQGLDPLGKKKTVGPGRLTDTRRSRRWLAPRRR